MTGVSALTTSGGYSFIKGQLVWPVLVLQIRSHKTIVYCDKLFNYGLDVILHHGFVQCLITLLSGYCHLETCEILLKTLSTHVSTVLGNF